MNNDIENRQYSVELQLRLADGDGRTIYGMAVPYNKEQRINGTITEIFRKGVFADVIRAPHRVKLLRGHGENNVLGRATLLKETDEGLQPILNRVVSKWKDISEEDKREEFKSLIQSYVRLYGYISQIITYEDIELEKLFIFLKYVNKKLPKGESTRLDIFDSVDLDSLRIQKTGEYKLTLVDKTGEVEPFSPEGSKDTKEENLDLLSEILKKVNEVFGVEITDNDRVNIKKVNNNINSIKKLNNKKINRKPSNGMN